MWLAEAERDARADRSHTYPRGGVDVDEMNRLSREGGSLRRNFYRRHLKPNHRTKMVLLSFASGSGLATYTGDGVDLAGRSTSIHLAEWPTGPEVLSMEEAADLV